MHNRISIQRDQTIRKLEASLFQQLADIVTPTIPDVPKNEIKSVGVEDALRELIEIEKTGQGN